MQRFKRSRDRRRETGASAVEYAILAALLGVVIVLAVSLLGNSTAGLFSGPCEELKSIGKPCT